MDHNYFITNYNYYIQNIEKPTKSSFELNQDEITSVLSNIEKQLDNVDLEEKDYKQTLDLLIKTFTTLESEHCSQLDSVLSSSLLHKLLPLINHINPSVQAYAYLSVDRVSNLLDHDELVENMMDRLICFSWDFDDDMTEFLNSAKLSSVYFDLFGKGLQKMTKARDWMLFMPFLSNYIVKTIHILQSVLKEQSIYFNANSKERTFSKWDEAITLTINTYLDYVHFIHAVTITQETLHFPYNSVNIGLEIGDVKRRYLGYYLLNLIYEKIILNFDMKLSKLYYEFNSTLFHATLLRRKIVDNSIIDSLKDAKWKPVFDIVHRCLKLSKNYGFTPENILQLYTSLTENAKPCNSKEDEMYENDRQMINSRLYPLHTDGIACLLSLSFYDKCIRPLAFKENIGLLPDEIDAYHLSKKFIGSLLNIITRPTDFISRTDKGIFVMLYLSNHIKTTINMEDMDKPLPGSYGSILELPVSSTVEFLSTTASTCPDDSIRFLSFKLIEIFLNFGDDEVKVFFITELIENCPFSSMNTAAIGLLKMLISNAYAKKEPSIFLSPLVVDRFFPIIFKFNPSWEKESDTFWDDYNYIMEALSLYYSILSLYFPTDLLTIRNEDKINTMKTSYLEPLYKLIQKFDPDKVNTMSLLIDWIFTKFKQYNF